MLEQTPPSGEVSLALDADEGLSFSGHLGSSSRERDRGEIDRLGEGSSQCRMPGASPAQIQGANINPFGDWPKPNTHAICYWLRTEGTPTAWIYSST